MDIDSILNSTIKFLTACLLSVMLLIGTIFVLPPAYALDFELSTPLVDLPVAYSGKAGQTPTFGNTDSSYYSNGVLSVDGCVYFDISQYLTTDDAIKISGSAVQTIDSAGYGRYLTIGQANSSGALLTGSNSTFMGKSGYVQPATYNVSVSYLNRANYAGEGYYLYLDSPNCTFDINGLSIYGFSASSGGGGAYSYPLPVDIEPGYVYYICTQGGSVELTTTFPKLSAFSRPLWNSLATINFGVADRPSSGTVFNSSSGSVIDWLIPASAPTNYLGRSYVGGRTYSDLPSDGTFVVIYNPAFLADGSAAPTITANFTNCGAIASYPLVTSFSNGEYTSSSSSNYADYYLAVGGSDFTTNSGIHWNHSYINSNGDIVTEPAILPDNTSNIVVDNDNSISGFINKIVNLLSAPIAYIRNLVSAGSSFMGQFANLYSWLPSPVLTILESALVCLVVIGVLKLLF